MGERRGKQMRAPLSKDPPRKYPPNKLRPILPRFIKKLFGEDLRKVEKKKTERVFPSILKNPPKRSLARILRKG